MQHWRFVTGIVLALVFATVTSCGDESSPPPVEPVLTKTGTGGGSKGGSTFAISFPKGGYLVGIQCHVVPNGGTFIIPAFSAKYETKDGREWAQRDGQPRRGGKKIDLMAKEGYAVGAVTLRGGAFFIQSLRLTFMKVTPTGLDPKDSYFSEVVGADLGATTIDSNGHFIVGVHGRSGGGNVNALGFITANAANRALVHGAGKPEPQTASARSPAAPKPDTPRPPEADKAEAKPPATALAPAAPKPDTPKPPHTDKAEVKPPAAAEAPSAPEAPSLATDRLTIQHARYTDGKKWADVTKAVRDQAGQYLLVTHPNPHYQQAKQTPSDSDLEIRYGAGRISRTVRFVKSPYPIGIVPPSDPLLLEHLRGRFGAGPAILEARYGHMKKWADVTEALRRQWEATGEITPSDSLASPSDISVGAPNQLFVSYLLNDRIELLEMRTGQTERLPPRPAVTFRALDLPDSVTSYAMTEDGRHVVITFERSNQVMFWDVAAGRPIVTRSTPAPRAVLCRGDRIFVGNFGRGTISVFGRAAGFQLINELRAGGDHVVSMTAPAGEHFNDELIVTTRDPQTRSAVYRLDIRKDHPERIAEHNYVTVSADGRFVLASTQTYSGTPNADVLSVWPYREYAAGNVKPQPPAGHLRLEPMMYQIRSGLWWFSHRSVFAGDPLTRMGEYDSTRLAVPDYTQPAFYHLDEHMLYAARMSPSLAPAGKRRVRFEPAADERFQQSLRITYLDVRVGGYYGGYPFAATIDGTLHLFTLNDATHNHSSLLYANTPAFDLSDVSTARNDVPGNPYDIPARAATGVLLRYQMPLTGDAQRVMLVSGPEGLTLTPHGQLVWLPRDDQVGRHELKVRVGDGEGDEAIIVRIHIEVIDPILLAKAAGDLSKVHVLPQLELTPEPYHVSYGREYASLLVVQGRTLKLLEADGVTVRETVDLPRPSLFAGERQDAWIVVTDHPHEVQVIDRVTKRVRSSVKLDPEQVTEVSDLVVHPDIHLSFIAVRDSKEAPRYHIYVYDEAHDQLIKTGAVGTFLAMHPAGSRLYAALVDKVAPGQPLTLGSDLKLRVQPVGNDVELMLEYDITASGGMRPTRIVDRVGRNGGHTVISPDGKWVGYASEGGKLSDIGHLPVWRTESDAIEEVLLPCEPNDARPSHVSFHPMLPLAATPAGNGAAVFRLPDGKFQSDRMVTVASKLGDVEVLEVYFAPDGRHLICLIQDKLGQRRLVQAPLRLNDAEKAHVERGWQRPDPLAPMQPKPLMIVNAAELDGMRPRVGGRMTQTQIATQYMNAVTVVTSGGGTGTGCFIGKTGYVLTCAHVIRNPDKIHVRYRRPEGKTLKHITVPAVVAHVDWRRDLALLKIDVDQPVPYVHLAGATQKIRTGESVVVIGNPGLGDAILDYTLTTGVVSSENRDFGGFPFIQTSAAVNPGNSGGPMFDERGQVIGIVTLKANIEGAGFAVPVADLRAFLQAAIE